jgi:integrase
VSRPHRQLTVSAALTLYFKSHVVPFYGEGSATTRRIGEMVDVVRRLFGREPADSFRGRQLKKVRDYLVNERRCKRTGRQLTRIYINYLVRCAVRCWVWLLSEDEVGGDCVAALRAVESLHRGRGGRESARVLPPPPGWDRVLHHLTPTVRAMALTQVYGGMRPQDVCRMRRSDLSIKPGERVEFPGHLGRYVEAFRAADTGVMVWVYLPRLHKGSHLGRPRAVLLGPKAQTVLAPLLGRLGPDDYVFSPRRSMREARIGPRAAVQEHFAVDVYNALIGRAIRRANRPLVAQGQPEEYLIPHWTPHQLRHLQGTAVGDRLDREHARALLGHSGSGDTIDRYMEQQMGKAAVAAALCG